MAEDQSTEPTPPLPPAGGDEQQKRPPKMTLKTPPKPEDIPSLQSTLLLMKHDFSPRQQQCLASNKGYQAITKKCGQFADAPRKLALCCSRELCPKQYVELIACIRTTRDPSMCHEFRDEVERCGARTSQRLLRVALADEWF